MTGKARIEGLTLRWYVFAVFSALCSILVQGIGFFTITSAVFGLFFSWLLTFFIGRALLRRSPTTRGLLLVAAAVFGLLGAIGLAKMTWSFVHGWEFGLLVGAVYSAAQTWMNITSLGTLTDGSVKAYVG